MILSLRRFVAFLALFLLMFITPVQAKSYDVNPNPDELPSRRIVIITRQEQPGMAMSARDNGWAWLEWLWSTPIQRNNSR